MDETRRHLEKALRQLSSDAPDVAAIRTYIQIAINDLLDFEDNLKYRADKPIILVDFDGTITDYNLSIKHAELNPGFVEWVNEVINDYAIYIFSFRCNTKAGRWEIIDFLRRVGVPQEQISRFRLVQGKPPAHYIIDDRAITFKGSWDIVPGKSGLDAFRPWYYSKNRSDSQ